MDSDEDWTPESLRAMPEPAYTDDTIVKFVKDYVPAGRVLDLGCGTGKWIGLWLKNNYQIEGYDQCPKAIELAKQRFPTVPFHLGRAQSLPFKSEFDLIYTIAVLQHNRHAYKDTIIEEIKKALKPQAYYLMSENVLRKDNWHYTGRTEPFNEENSTDGYSYTYAGWIRFFDSHNIKLTKFEWPFFLFKVS